MAKVVELPPEVVQQALGRAAHEVNRAYCAAQGDDSQMPWEVAPEWLRVSVLKGVRGVLCGNTPEQGHESWLREKYETGWKHGLVKDVEKKEHPNMVHYSLLPPIERKKDALFVATVLTLGAALGYVKQAQFVESAMPLAVGLLG